mmetsp:Transcript_71774/g.191502  ORF Transcript_71774/g.191502 Transcript_71774/m.191502 type:complete len:356 (-) Transcript_71774:2947-4014(-)
MRMRWLRNRTPARTLARPAQTAMPLLLHPLARAAPRRPYYPHRIRFQYPPSSASLPCPPEGRPPSPRRHRIRRAHTPRRPAPHPSWPPWSTARCARSPVGSAPQRRRPPRQSPAQALTPPWTSQPRRACEPSPPVMGSPKRGQPPSRRPRCCNRPASRRGRRGRPPWGKAVGHRSSGPTLTRSRIGPRRGAEPPCLDRRTATGRPLPEGAGLGCRPGRPVARTGPGFPRRPRRRRAVWPGRTAPSSGSWSRSLPGTRWSIRASTGCRRPPPRGARWRPGRPATAARVHPFPAGGGVARCPPMQQQQQPRRMPRHRPVLQTKSCAQRGDRMLGPPSILVAPASLPAPRLVPRFGGD